MSVIMARAPPHPPSTRVSCQCPGNEQGGDGLVSMASSTKEFVAVSYLLVVVEVFPAASVIGVSVQF